MNKLIKLLKGGKRDAGFPGTRNLPMSIFLIVSAIILFSAAGNAQMFWNHAGSFADSGYVAVRHAPELDITGSFTLEAWVRPSVIQTGMLLEKRDGAASEGYSLYLTANRPAIRTNVTTRLRSTDTLQVGVWSHLAVTYDAGADRFTILINGLTDTSRIVAAADPVSTTDSLIIGLGFNGRYRGDLDNVRIWDRPLTQPEIFRNMRTPLGARGGVYSGLVLAMTFEDDDGGGAAFSLADWSGEGNFGLNRGVQALDLSNRPQTYLTFNESVKLDGANDYLAGANSSAVSPDTAVTLEAWIHPTTAGTAVILSKGGGETNSYRFFLTTTSNTLRAGISNTFVSADSSVPVGQWSHVAFTYRSATQTYQFFLNGNPAGSGSLLAGSIFTGPDSLFIGGGLSLSDFEGYIDEVRICKYAKTEAEIGQFLYASIDQANEPRSGLTNVAYNLDGLNRDNCNDGGPVLWFRGNAIFSNPSTVSNQPVSPMTRADDLSFTEGYYLKTSNRRIPASGTSGETLNDSLFVNHPASISDLNLFLATNHTFEQDLEVTLIAPNGDSILVQADKGHLGFNDNVITLYDDQADSMLVSSSYMSFSPRIQPQNSLNAFSTGMTSQGTWQIRIFDDAGGDTGRLYAWGLQFNNATSLTDPILAMVDVNPAWNLLAVPVEPVDPLKTAVFPTAISSAFTYGPAGYQNADTLEPGKAFWLKFFAGTTVPVNGFEAPGISVDVNAAWNMIGGINTPVAISSITSNPPGIVTSQFFEYLGLYLNSDTLRPGKGYWVKVTQPGTLNIGTLPSADPSARIRIRPIAETPPPPPGDEGFSADTPEEYALGEAYPNPFNATATIRYQLPVESHVTMKVYNLVGQVVKVLRDEPEGAGYKIVTWNADALSSGAYFLRLDATGIGMQAGTFSQVRKIVLLK